MAARLSLLAVIVLLVPAAPALAVPPLPIPEGPDAGSLPVPAAPHT